MSDIEPALSHVSPWMPISDPQTLAVVSKTQEELNELGKVLARMTMQGLDGADPKDGTPNMVALREEVADVRAMLGLVEDFFGLPVAEVKARVARKRDAQLRWHRLMGWCLKFFPDA